MTTAPADTAFMARAVALARLGRGWVNPNPMVGAVVVKDGKVVGEGFHPRLGEAHAEVVALQQAGEAAKGSTLYVSLEPCDHEGRTPPCTRAIVAAGVARVVFGQPDPNPINLGSARRVLEAAGIEVDGGILAEEASELNRPFARFIRSGLPYVVCKMAMSLDGKIGTAAGRSQWISGPEARARVQEWRATYAAIMVGVGTVLIDDPSLACRIEGAHQPVKVIVDPLASLPRDARIFGGGGPVWVAVNQLAPPDRLKRLEAAGARILHCAGRHGDLDVRDLLMKLGQEGLDSVLLEGGGGLNARLMRANLVDRYQFFVAPVVIGGRNAPTPAEGVDIRELSEAVRLGPLRSEQVGEDILITADSLPFND